MATFAKTFDWRITGNDTQAAQFAAYHGETVRFNLIFSGAASNLTAQAIYYQTNGMGRTYFPPIPGTVFHPTNDCGAAVYRFFIRCTDPDGINYSANGLLRLLDSPGFEPSVVELPVKTLDFSTVEILNAPYYTKAETAAALREGLAVAASSATNYTDSATTNLNARPVTIPSTSAGRGVTFVDGYGENQNVAIEIGEGARAAVTTNELEAAPDNKVVRSTGVAVGGHAEVRNDADPLKVQGVALGWHAQVSAINGVAIGSGAQHTNETGQTSGATVASAPKAIAIGYGAKSTANDAVQLGEGANSEPGTLKYRDVTIVKDGKVATDPAVTNTLARHEAALDTIMADYARLDFAESNSVKRVTIQNDNYTFRVVTDTNRADGVALTMGDAEIYGTAAVDRRLADKANAVRNIIDDRPSFTTNDIWVCEQDGQVLTWSKSGNSWLWQNTAKTRALMRTGGGYNFIDTAADIRWMWSGYSSDIASVLTFTDGQTYTFTRSNPSGSVVATVPVAYIDDIPPAVSNTVTKAYVEGLGISADFSTNNTELVETIAAAETDPTVPAWAKAAQKPTYSAAEVGAATMGDIIRVVSGTNVVLVITNYNSAVHAPSMKIQRLNPETGEFETYWDETIRHGMTLDSAKEYTDNATNNLAAVKADRAFGKYTSGFGVDAPKGVTWLSGGTTVFGAGHDFAKTVTSSGEIFILVNSGLMLTNVECPTNSAFWQLEANGETLYRVEKTSSHVVNINIHAVSVVDPYLLIDLSGWIYPEHPVARVRLDLADADWLKEEDYTGGVIPGVAAITWLGSGSANDPYICQIENLSGGDKIFAGLWYEAPGATKIIANGVSDLTKGIYYNGATYLPSVSGNELKFIRAQ